MAEAPEWTGEAWQQFEDRAKKKSPSYIRQLRAENYRPTPVKRVWIPKQGSPEKRPLGVPSVRDRIVQTALRNVIEPIFERDFAPQSYGFRPKRGCKEALRRVEQLLKEEKVWVVDADIKGYFDTIPHGPLMKRIGGKIADGRVLRLIEAYLKAGVMESVKSWRPSERGTPQGAVISPLLANIYLDPLDWEMARAGIEMVRYADDCAPRARAASREVRLLARNCATDEGKKAPRDLLAGAGLKSPSAAAVKSHSGEHKKEKAWEEPGQMSAGGS